jgi:indolepyruvate decarboxylase
VDISQMAVSRNSLARPLVARVSDTEQLAAFSERLAAALEPFTELQLLVGPLAHRRAVEPVLRVLADRPGVAIATQSASKAILDESHPANLGVYAGVHTDSTRTRRLIDEAEPLILVGVVLTDLLTGFFSHEFDADAAIALNLDHARVGQEVFYDVFLDDALQVLDEVLSRREPITPSRASSPFRSRAIGATAEEHPLNHAALWPLLQDWMRPGTTVLADAGTSFYGAVGLSLPDDCDLLGQPIWSSIGYTLPATLGVLLGTPDREALLLIGDGSAQLTIQELATITHRHLAPTIIVIDNAGYTVERLILGPDAVYQDVVPWNWTTVALAFGVSSERIFSVSSSAELAAALRTADGSAATFIHAIVPRDDAPELLLNIARGLR